MTYTVHVTHTIGDLARDLAQIPVKAAKECQEIVRDGAKAGAILARTNAERTAGAHGKHYPKSITSEQRSPYHFGGGSVFSAEYGPDIAKNQGGMSFEYGSRNQPPHLDLARSADIIGPALAQEVRQMLDRLFW